MVFSEARVSTAELGKRSPMTVAEGGCRLLPV